MYCPICGGTTFIEFRGRPNSQCSSCNSKERHRRIYLAILPLAPGLAGEGIISIGTDAMPSYINEEIQIRNVKTLAEVEDGNKYSVFVATKTSYESADEGFIARVIELADAKASIIFESVPVFKQMMGLCSPDSILVDKINNAARRVSLADTYGDTVYSTCAIGRDDKLVYARLPV